jgi:tetratricopeptide (TPR) repeat protein
LAALALAGWSGLRLEAMDELGSPGDDLLYLPNGRMLRVASLGQAPVIADAIYLWAIQFYSNYEREDRFKYVEHVFGDVIGELDPDYIDPYWIGALILAVEARDLEAAHRLLDKGFERNPEAWILPYLAGWEAYFVGRYDLAREYFEKAAAVPDAPPRVLRMIAGMEARAGDLDESRALWQEVIDDPRSDAPTRAIAERKVREYTVRLAVRACTEAVGTFQEQNGRWPDSLGEAVAAGYLSDVPRDADGREYGYDPRTGAVTGPGAILGDQ